MEGEILQRINAGLTEDLKCRYRELIDKRTAESLTADENAELLRLTEVTESLQADRVAALMQLVLRHRVILG